MVRVVELSSGFRTVNIELIVVVIITLAIIWLVLVALTTTVYSKGSSFKVSSNCPASFTSLETIFDNF